MEENKRSIKGIKKGVMLAGIIAMATLTAVGCGKKDTKETESVKQEQTQEEKTEVKEEDYEIENRLEEELQEVKKSVNKELLDIANEFRLKMGPCIDTDNKLGKKIAYELIEQEAVRYPKNLSDKDRESYVYDTYVASNSDTNSFKIENFKMAGYITEEGTNICIFHEGEVFKQDIITEDGTLYSLTLDSESYGPYMKSMEAIAVPCVIEDPEKEDLNIPLITGTSVGIEEKSEEVLEEKQDKYAELDDEAFVEQLKQDVLKAEEDPKILIEVTNEYRKRLGGVAGDRNFEDNLADLLVSYQLVVVPTDEEVDRDGQIEYARNAYVVGKSVDIREMKVTKEKVDGGINYYNVVGSEIINFTRIENGIVYSNCPKDDISMRSIIRINREGASCVGQTVAPEVEMQGGERE